MTTISRRDALRLGAGAGVLLATGAWWPARGATLRQPDSLPDPTRPAGVPDPGLPIDHVVVVMMENHSFDNYLGMLPPTARSTTGASTAS